MRLEPRANTSWLARLACPVLSLAVAAAISGGLAMLAGANPLKVFVLIYQGAIGSTVAQLETLTRATPLIFTGLAAATAFRAKLWNFGGEAQFYAGALATTVLGTGLLPLPAPLLIPVIIIAAALAGAITLYVPTLLRTRFGVDEAVTTLLFNFIALLFVGMMLEGFLNDPQSRDIVSGAALFRLVPGNNLHAGFLLAIACAVAVWFIQRKSVLGYEMRAIGENAKAATFAGIPVNKVLLKTAMISGGLAALGGFSEVAGLKGNLTLELSQGIGYTGIIVAILAMLHPIGVVFAAIIVAGIFVGADAMSSATGVPSHIAHVMVAISLLTMATATVLTRYRLRWR
jgi:simple sugar transport system permease protein